LSEKLVDTSFFRVNHACMQPHAYIVRQWHNITSMSNFMMNCPNLVVLLVALMVMHRLVSNDMNELFPHFISWEVSNKYRAYISACSEKIPG
jgi:hypothetical protein